MGGFADFLTGAIIGGVEGVDKQIDKDMETQREMGLAEWKEQMRQRYAMETLKKTDEYEVNKWLSDDYIDKYRRAKEAKGKADKLSEFGILADPDVVDAETQRTLRLLDLKKLEFDEETQWLIDRSSKEYANQLQDKLASVGTIAEEYMNEFGGTMTKYDLLNIWNSVHGTDFAIGPAEEALRRTGSKDGGRDKPLAGQLTEQLAKVPVSTKLTTVELLNWMAEGADGLSIIPAEAAKELLAKYQHLQNAVPDKYGEKLSTFQNALKKVINTKGGKLLNKWLRVADNDGFAVGQMLNENGVIVNLGSIDAMATTAKEWFKAGMADKEQGYALYNMQQISNDLKARASLGRTVSKSEPTTAGASVTNDGPLLPDVTKMTGNPWQSNSSGDGLLTASPDIVAGDKGPQQAFDNEVAAAQQAANADPAQAGVQSIAASIKKSGSHLEGEALNKIIYKMLQNHPEIPEKDWPAALDMVLKLLGK